ncbi:muramidase family protein [Puniceicoccus vermicola]|uniref:LysM peptidoglycan-binding domain-containing protein n=1 Tax=Puniceicoccus vermicola TaxID=388746 RepID=A0A7X1B3S5_9BACT|nr:LysM peptidoglycan-binding domain-containing protein [Puniceicoccus vermicola]MBC2603988.1 LysM peptidoglycan-binding domain-containing protein [Puniceicoccus vermicola]
MKFFKVFSLVVVGHILLIGAFLLQQGCQSIDRQWEEYRREKQNVTVPKAVLAQEQGLPVDSKDIDPSFNNGFSGSGEDGRATRVRSTPTRPTSTAGGMGNMGTDPEPMEPLFGPEPSEPLFNPGLGGGFNSGASPMDSGPTAGYVPYTVQSGDTLWGLSKEYNVSFPALLEANGMDRNSQLKVGQEILVPSGYGEISETTTVIEEETVPGTTIYEVRRGDTLSEIAVRAGTSVSRIKNLNNMSSDRIRIGQKLIVPGEIVVVEEEQTTVSVNPSEFTAVHEVKSGETLSGIANRYGMSVSELLAVNNISDPRRLRAGTDLKVRPASATSKLSSPSSSNTTPFLPARAPSAMDSFNVTEEETITAEEVGPTAPEIIPESGPSPVESEALGEDEGFGAEIFEDFGGVEEVPVERRDSTGG